jgi:hypothetical protein
LPEAAPIGLNVYVGEQSCNRWRRARTGIARGVAEVAKSVDVSLPRSHQARFPDRCVVCGADKPGSHVRIITGTIGWWTWLLWWWGTPFVAKAPSCTWCAWRLHGLRILSLVVTVAICVLALWLIWPHLKDLVPRPIQKWAALALGLICLLPQCAFEIYFARPFDVTAYRDSVDYEFTSRDYALEFAVENLDATWVKVNGALISDDEAALGE